MWLSFFLSRGICWTITEQSPQRDKFLQQGAHFGPHLVKVRSVTKSSKEGHILDSIWSKSAAWQSPPMRGTFWTTFGKSPLHDKVIQWGAHFGPHLVEVRCVTKSSNEGRILDHIWLKFAAWQNPPTRGTFWTTFGWSPLRDKVLQRGAYFQHVWPKSTVWQSPPLRGGESFAVLGYLYCVDFVSNEELLSFSHIGSILSHQLSTLILYFGSQFG